MDSRPAENALPNLSATAVAPGSWAFVRRGKNSKGGAMKKLSFLKRGKSVAVVVEEESSKKEEPKPAVEIGIEVIANK